MIPTTDKPKRSISIPHWADDGAQSQPSGAGSGGSGDRRNPIPARTTQSAASVLSIHGRRSTTASARSDRSPAPARARRRGVRALTERIGRPSAPVGADYADLIARGTTWVAEHDGRIVGFVVLIKRPDHLLLDNVAVTPDAQGLGIGPQQLRLAEETAARSGLEEIRLVTNEAMTENLGYYARKGYVETGRGVQDGYRRVFFRKIVGSARNGISAGC